MPRGISPLTRSAAVRRRSARRKGEEERRRFVEELAVKYPPLRLAAADLTVRAPETVRARWGPAFSYLARVELEVERNVLELRTLLPRAGDTDRLFYEHVWSPQELQHGVLLDALQAELGLPPAPVNNDRVSTKIKVLGALTQVPGVHDVVRLLYYLTGAATERAAVIAYSRLMHGLGEMSEHALAETVIGPIRRQEPGHFAFYRMSAESLVRDELEPWQLSLARTLRSRSFEVVGVNDAQQRAEFGRVAAALGLHDDLPHMARQISRVERDLLWAHQEGMEVPRHVLRALDRAVQAAAHR